MAKRGPNFSKFVLNCTESAKVGIDWSFEDAADALETQNDAAEHHRFSSLSADLKSEPPSEVDLRAGWWGVRDQGKNGACVGFATADGVLRWLYVTSDLMGEDERPSPRFIWMANKETDDLTRYPTSFIERAGTSTKLALDVALKYGCVPESMLRMDGSLSKLRTGVFFSIAAQFRITAYYNLQRDLDHWRRWIASAGPILTRLNVDNTWKNASRTSGVLQKYDADGDRYGGHAVCLVGYTKDQFIVRNSWGTNWGDGGFAYASNEYAEQAFTEAYGAVL